MRPAAIGTILAMALAGSACAQYTSPAASTSTTIDGKKITIDYHAPSLHGRKMLGGKAVPYGHWWRTGANAATSLTTDATLKIGDLTVPPGKYTIYSIPEADSFTLIVNKQTGQWGTEYNEAQDLGRVKMNVSHPSSPIETFKITLANSGGNQGTLTMEWQDMVATIPFTVQ